MKSKVLHAQNLKKQQNQIELIFLWDVLRFFIKLVSILNRIHFMTLGTKRIDHKMLSMLHYHVRSKITENDQHISRTCKTIFLDYPI